MRANVVIRKPLKVRDLCFVLGVTERCLRSRISRGDVPRFYRVGRALRWRLEEVERWQLAQEEMAA